MSQSDIRDQARRATSGQLLVSALFFSVISVAFSWPLALFRRDLLYTRQFDTYGVLWMTERAYAVLHDFVDYGANYPVGNDLSRPDAWIHLLVSAFAHGHLEPFTVFSLFVLIGPVASAMAAERCAALALGVRFPWSLVAGTAFGFCGLAATAWLEGHVYFLFNPWLPLLLLALSRATGPDARIRDGVAAGVSWTLSLLTTSYLGICASLLVVAMAARGLVVRAAPRRLLRSYLPMGAVIGAVGLGYVWMFLHGAGGHNKTPGGWVGSGSATLATLATWTPDVDFVLHHSITAPLGFGTLALIAFAPLVLRRIEGWRTLLLVAGASVVLASGAAIQVGLGESFRFSSPLSGLEKAPLASLLHFPVRMMWLYYLCAGMVAARVADVLARRAGARWAAPLLLLCVVDALAGTGAPLRTRSALAAIPSAYLQAPEKRAVLDVAADLPGTINDDDVAVFRNLTCYYQTVHHRPVMDSCLMPDLESPRQLVSRRLIALALEWSDAVAQGAPADVGTARALLQDLGIGAVAVHVDLLAAEDRRPILAALEAVAGQPVVTHDGGETIALYAIPEKAGVDPLAAYEALAGGVASAAPGADGSSASSDTTTSEAGASPPASDGVRGAGHEPGLP